MEQQQSFKVSFAVGTKLLISVVSLLLIAIIFLNTSAIFLLIDDKRAYTYKTQATEALLAGRDFTGTTKSALDTLRLALGSVNPNLPIDKVQKSRLEAVLNNQSELFHIGLYLAPLESKSAEERKSRLLLAEHIKDAESLELLEKSEDKAFLPEAIQRALPDLLREGYAFFNASSLGKPPVLGVLVADRNMQKNPGGMPVAVGFHSLNGFGQELGSSDVTIADRNGQVLFATNPETLFTVKSVARDPLFERSLASKVASGTQEFENESQHYLGSYLKPGFDLVVMSRIEWRKAMRAAYELTEKFILLGCMAIGAAILFAILFSKTMTAPINRLYAATREVAAGNFNVNLEVTGKDEIAALTHSFGVMAREITSLISEKVRKAHLENELAIASTVQQTLIPPPKFENDDVLIHSLYQSASECGGDWWGFFGVGRKLCVMIADATGHGLPSALITASARSCFSVMHKLAVEQPEFSFSPGAMLAYANRVIFDASHGKIMMTFFAGVIDFDEGTFTYASAGHNPPWLFKHNDGKYTLKSLTSLGQRLGEARDVPDFSEKTVELSENDILFLYTDGLLEGKDLGGEQFGKKRVKKLVEGALERGPEAVLQDLMEPFLAHNTGKEFDDDVTLAVAKIKKIGKSDSA